MTVSLKICNDALTYAKQDAQISSIDEESVESTRCLRIYENTRKSILQDFNWGFNVRTEKLTVISSEGLSDGYQYSYALPSNLLTIIKIGDVNDRFMTYQEGNKLNIWEKSLSADGKSVEIHSNVELAQAKVAIDVDTVALYDPLFEEYFAYSMAMKLATMYRIDAKLYAQVQSEYAYAMSRAKEHCSNQDSVAWDDHNEYVTARNGNGVNYGQNNNIEL
jgi:hypothetical protein